VFSENIDPKHWMGITDKAAEKIRDGAEGVVITHGTDTMGYSSAAISFALRNLPVPVIFVGSQRSSDRPSSDAATNLISTVATAACSPFAEVALGMHEKTSDTSIVFHRGTKVRKCHTSARYAFQSVNSTPLARFSGGKLKMLMEDYRKRGKRELEVLNNFERRVALVKFYPALDSAILDWYVENSYKGIILEGTGLGHVSQECYGSLSKAVKGGMLVGMTSQCIWGRTDMDVYVTGRELQKIGVDPLGDMLPETALVKMMWALANSDDIHKARELMKRNLSGEFSDRTLYVEGPF
jgi:glutamyl-tRNA(Gln) amidotransferase subunit D